ncbi:uncharacterized protein LOC143029218 [Oratosquilla oratoria]|uniref:uncharacterized protein LOC143029218 n=1 Tax=Oratosquilla oratoria TaxID=337810 RepID=UPI003F7776FD
MDKERCVSVIEEDIVGHFDANDLKPEVEEIVIKLKGGKAVCICNISGELPKAVGEAMISGLHGVLSGSPVPLPLTGKRVWSSLSPREKGTGNNCRGITQLSVPGEQGFLAAYFDLKKSFDLEHYGVLWDLLRIRRIPARIIDLISGLYCGKESAARYREGVSSFFPVNLGVIQGCFLNPTLINTCMN